MDIKFCEIKNEIFSEAYKDTATDSILTTPKKMKRISQECSVETCEKIATHGFRIDGNKTRCAQHKQVNMANLANPLCHNVECNKQPSFGIEGGRATHCAGCKSGIMVDVRNAKCFVCKKKQPNFGIEGRATHCVGCKSGVMRNTNFK
jgi:hypothetical protein